MQYEVIDTRMRLVDTKDQQLITIPNLQNNIAY